jgi:hypothetical protein
MAVPAMDTDVSGSNVSSSDDVAPSQANATWIALRASTGDTEKPLSLRTLPCLNEHMNATSFLNTPLLLPITERNFCFITRHFPTHCQWRWFTHQPFRYESNLIKRKLAAEILSHNNWCSSRDSVCYALFLKKGESSIFRFLHCLTARMVLVFTEWRLSYQKFMHKFYSLFYVSSGIDPVIQYYSTTLKDRHER